ncbi:MAG: hypothetical protein AB7G75_30035 [Candidatus Binatia bacterium]
MHLFDEVSRPNTGPALYGEPRSEYLNRSGRPTATRVRRVLEDWFSRYPIGEQRELKARLRSEDDEHFYSAFFELYLHELLTRLDYKVQVHPRIPGGTLRRPDFLVEKLGIEPFYLEAAITMDLSKEEAAAEARVNQAYDALNRLESPDFFLWLKVYGSPATPIPAKRLRAAVAKFLHQQDPQECTRLLYEGGLSALPSRKFSHDGWIIEYTTIAKSPEARGEPGVRPVGIIMPGAVQRLDKTSAVRTKIRGKGSGYGDLGLPYIVAVNAVTQRLENEDSIEILFGSEQLIFSQSNPELRCVRVLDGVWTSRGRPTNRRVSAALIVSSLIPWSIARCVPVVYHNPWASRPCHNTLAELTTVLPIDDNMELRNGIGAAELFSLSSDWPGSDDDNDA